ncbi:2,3-diketo-L-gulonate-binding periplasmic protein YiaO precursor [Pseudobythopirellula maris]|uniref:2,3-diketo-L-gulonate-binding periplasmic protein YiaO n=2 Tax=Pseudobythopirellula maris TaxID=2527991 RepID=A0A5C5ZJM2_9BACT|nr:2,3-diketo-L-gulonate-binding periplasmic protein YiaO precursor [Pseudobythopirellula maris]
MFAAGVLVGLLVATCGYTWVLRQPSGAVGGVAVKELKLGHSLDLNHPVHLAMERMAERLEELSGGRLTLSISPNGQLGNEVECIELTQRGSMALTKTSTATLEGFLPEFAAFGVPYLFRDEEHFWSVLHGEIGDELLEACTTQNLRGLCWYDAGARSFYTVKTPINTPADLKGLKIRVQESKTAIAMVEALGGAPTPMNFGELYTSLQQSLVDGAENNPPSFSSSRHYEVCKEYSLDEHTMVPDLLLVSEIAWQKLSEQEQGWLRQAAADSAVLQRELWKERSDKALEVVQESGVQVTRPDKQPFIDAVRPMHESYEGTDVGALLERILAVE